MKLAKKFVSAILAAVMVMAVTATAFAATGTNNIKLTTPIKSTDEFAAYQIFAGTEAVVNGQKVLTKIEWGDGVNNVTLLDALKANTPANAVFNVATTEGTKNRFANAKTAEDVAKALNNVGYDYDVAQAFAAIVAKNLSETKSGTYAYTAGSESVDPYGQITGVADGYYLVQNESVAYDSAMTRFILSVVGGTTTTATVKADAPEMTKKVKETNDSDPDAGTRVTDWQDASDYDIGDDVPYQIKTTVVDNYADYEHYYLAFNDTMDPGLTFNNDVVVKVDGTVVQNTNDTTYYTVKTGNDAAPYTFIVEIMDLKKYTAAHAGSVVTVEYSAKLNENATLGSDGNENTANMKFSNNPNSDWNGTTKPTEGTGETPPDTVITFTYKTIVDKVDKVSQQALAGAKFTLYKFYKEYDGNLDYNDYVEVKSYTSGSETRFTFTGLDAGNYKLVETEPPAGYNKIADITFTIGHEFGEEDGEDNLVLKDLTADPPFTVTKSNGGVIGNVAAGGENEKGPVLPSTGGMGTTLFYIVGGILVAGASIVLVTRKRMSV